MSRSARRLLAAAALLIPVAAAAPPAAASRLHVETVCFTVHNPGDPVPSTLFGRRYSVGRPGPATPAIVLVHGVASSADDWDIVHGYSVARDLARRGFVAIAYDRLGFDRSVYDRPKGGLLVTTPNQRDILHQVVGAVQGGGYAVARGADCSAPSAPSTLASPTVVIAGHSAGGGIVQGYPGAYHDVAAMVQANYSNRGQGPIVDQQLTEVVAPALAAGADEVPFFRTRAECEAFDVYAPGVVRKAARAACDPARFVLTPAGEWTGFPALQQQNDLLVPMTGAIPVLLTYGDHDAAFPPDVSAADAAHWQATCACDVTAWTEPTSGHLFQVHAAMRAWVDEVVSWLASRGIAPA